VGEGMMGSGLSQEGECAAGSSPPSLAPFVFKAAQPIFVQLPQPEDLNPTSVGAIVTIVGAFPK